MRIDECGHAVTGATEAQVDQYDRALRSMLLLADDVPDAWEATVADGDGFAMGHIARAYLRCLSSEAPDAADARAILDGLGDGGGLTDREQRHLAAARAYSVGDLYGASERLAALSVEYPTDALALNVGHLLDFYCGDAMSLRDRTGRVLLAWDHGHPLFGFVLGMHAFGLEECNLFPQAESAGMQALESEPRDVWAIHAVTHVYEMQSRIDDGLRFLDERRDQWTNGNYFVVHNAWHEALMRLGAGDIDGALGIYDTVLHHEGSGNVALEMVDATALLWRMHLDGLDVGDRWAPLADAWAAKADAEPWYVFNDAHAAMSYVGADRIDEARTLVDRLRSYAGGHGRSVANVAMTSHVGLPVCESIVAFGEGRFGDVVRALVPIRKDVQRFGGSNAQRDAVSRTLLEAAIRDGQSALATALVSERLAFAERSPYARRQLDRIRSTAA